MKSTIKLDFNGTELEFHFGLSFLGGFVEKYDVTPDEIVKKIISNTFVFVPLLMFESYLHNCERKEIKPSVTKLQLLDLIEETNFFLDGSEANKFLDVFNKSIYAAHGIDIDSITEQSNEEDVKKK